MFAIDQKTRQPRNLVTNGDSLAVLDIGTRSAGRQWFTTDNTPAGPRQLNVLGTLGAPANFRVGPPPGKKWAVTSVVTAISDNGPFSQDGFGAMPALTNGVQLMFYSTAGGYVDLYSGFAVKRNFEFIGLPGRTTMSTWNGGSQTMEVRFDIYADTGQAIVLDGDRGEAIAIRIRDDLTSLVDARSVARYVEL